MRGRRRKAPPPPLRLSLGISVYAKPLVEGRERKQLERLHTHAARWRPRRPVPSRSPRSARLDGLDARALVLELLQDGGDVAVRGVAPISNIGAGGVERADAHGIRVRRVD